MNLGINVGLGWVTFVCLFFFLFVDDVRWELGQNLRIKGKVNDRVVVSNSSLLSR